MMSSLPALLPTLLVMCCVPVLCRCAVARLCACSVGDVPRGLTVCLFSE